MVQKIPVYLDQAVLKTIGEFVLLTIFAFSLTGDYVLQNSHKIVVYIAYTVLGIANIRYLLYKAGKKKK